MTITGNEGLAMLLATAAVSAVLASGLTAAALIVFFQNLLSSPLALKLAEGLVNSFPPQTRELLHVIAQFVETVSQDPQASIDKPPAAATGEGALIDKK